MARRARRRRASRTARTNVVQIAPQATWECCADDVARVEYEANVPSGFYDPMRWVVRDDPSGLEHASTACDVTQAAGGLSMACAGAACDGSDPGEVRGGEELFERHAKVPAREVHDADRWNREQRDV